MCLPACSFSPSPAVFVYFNVSPPGGLSSFGFGIRGKAVCSYNYAGCQPSQSNSGCLLIEKSRNLMVVWSTRLAASAGLWCTLEVQRRQAVCPEAGWADVTVRVSRQRAKASSPVAFVLAATRRCGPVLGWLFLSQQPGVLVNSRFNQVNNQDYFIHSPSPNSSRTHPSFLSSSSHPPPPIKYSLCCPLGHSAVNLPRVTPF